MTREKEIEILMSDRCTRAEAEKHLKNGTIIFEDFEENLESYLDEWDIEEEDRDEYRKMDIEEMICRHPEYFTKQGKYVWENGLEGQVEDIMEKIQCSREMAVEYVYIMHRAFNGID